MDSPGFVWLLSHSSWFCLASTTCLIQIRNGAEHRILSIYFWTVFMDSLLVYVASFPQLLVLFGFHNSLRPMKLDYQFLAQIFENLMGAGGYYSLFSKSTAHIPNMKISAIKHRSTLINLALNS